MRTPGLAHTTTAQLFTQLTGHRVQALLPRTDKSEAITLLLAKSRCFGWLPWRWKEGVRGGVCTVYDTNMEEKEKQRREKRFPSPCVPSMHNYNAITKKTTAPI